MTGADGLPARQQLAARLRQLRELAGVSGRDLAQRVGISQPTVSRIEAGRTVPSLPVVEAWAQEVGASEETRERLAALVEATYTEVNTWRTAFGRRGHLQGDIREQEAVSQDVRVFQPSVVPGLLQTAEYARRVFSLFQLPYSDKDLAAAVAGRLERQAALYEGGRRFAFLITEAALRWRPGDARLLLAQLHRIASISTLDNVSIGLIPQDREAVTFLSHGFVIYDGEGPSVSVETIHANITVRDPSDVELYRARWSLLDRMAIRGDDALAFLDRIAADLRALSDG
ncbi:helix-turn-helix domain-containing protein [Actinokineospora fastidiosa]|uniref:Transcriptional regulator n=1 Tax=Actinokineospora fastidiosa TaxID=1816 RepID=A0A918LGE6_9PSEU|nr:helix-turn-helix transcriptional regulator [Actinokineospora fastidiosa]GGS45322.1 transcriptional regulator [Actinokineospora fastidiosa]